MAEEPTPSPTKPPSQLGDLIAQLLGSGDAWVKLLTLALIIFSGGWNWFATKDVGAANTADWQKARQEISQFFENQKTYLQGLQLLQQNNADTSWIRNTLQQNADSLKSNNAELATLKDEIEKLKAQLGNR